MADVYVPRGGWLVSLFALVLSAGVLIAGSTALPALKTHAITISLVGLVLFLSYCTGMKVLRWLRLYREDRFPVYARQHAGHWLPAPAPDPDSFRHLEREILSWEKAVFALGIGLGILSYATFALALTGGLSQLWIILLLLVCGLTVPGEVRRLYRYFQLPPSWRRRGENRRKDYFIKRRVFLWVIIIIPVMMSLIASLAPPHQSDAMRYHLAAPAAWTQAGQWHYMRDSAFSNFPFTIESLYMLFLTLGQDTACRVLHCSFFIGTLLAIHAFSRRMHSASAGLLSAAIFATIPFVPGLASWAFIEMGMTFYYVLTFYALVLWMNATFRRKGKKGWLGAYQLEPRSTPMAILAGICCGLAMGIKYTSLFLAVFCFFALLILMLWKKRQDTLRHFQHQTTQEGEDSFVSPQPRWLELFLFTLIASLVFLPWLVKNWIVTGNPFFPFFNSLFQSPHWNAFESAFYSFHAGQKGGLWASSSQTLFQKLVDLLRLPWLATIHHLGDWPIGPVFFVYTLVLVFFVRRIPRAARFLLIAALYFFLVWAFTYRDNRFLLPALAPLSLALGNIYTRMWRKPAHFVKPLLVLLLILLAINTLSIVFNIALEQNPFPAVSRRISRAQFLSRRLDYWPAMDFLNNLDTPYENGKVFMVGEYRPYYCQRPWIANDWFNQPVIVRYLRETGSLPAFIQRLRKEGVKYILHNKRELSKGDGSYGFFFHLHFLPVHRAIHWLQLFSQGALQQPAMRQALSAEVASVPSYQNYQRLFDSDLYLEKLTPGGILPEGINIYKLRTKNADPR
jgi:hypothetical protein